MDHGVDGRGSGEEENRLHDQSDQNGRGEVVHKCHCHNDEHGEVRGAVHTAKGVHEMRFAELDAQVEVDAAQVELRHIGGHRKAGDEHPHRKARSGEGGKPMRASVRPHAERDPQLLVPGAAGRRPTSELAEAQPAEFPVQISALPAAATLHPSSTNDGQHGGERRQRRGDCQGREDAGALEDGPVHEVEAGGLCPEAVEGSAGVGGVQPTHGPHPREVLQHATPEEQGGVKENRRRQEACRPSGDLRHAVFEVELRPTAQVAHVQQGGEA
mmetsp:Transcript_101482/g.282464  ORF Transcript_101482/g.282464 Transcript_101482/m.282464 type:complete len:271 (+) Transcript_101482:690-1502(+)